MSEAPAYEAPGVLIKTLPNTGPGPIESLATAVLAMIGFYQPKKPDTPDEFANKPVQVTSWAEFTGKYGSDPAPGAYLHQAMRGYFVNGGKRAYVVGIPAGNADPKDAFTKGIDALEAHEDITLLACPDVFATATPGISDGDVKTVQVKMIEHCEHMKDRFAILDLKQDLTAGDVSTGKWTCPNASSRAAAYHPWLLPSSANEFVPPSGHIAGMFARVDVEKGVHKPPANETILGVSALKYNVTRREQETLNPKSVNCIRQFPGYGIVSWGARTLSTDRRWQYINVQRLVSNISDSITHSIRWAVFEPNDQVLWAALRRDISAYLTRLWRQGALFGKAPGEAFYVRCDEGNNPQTDIDAGKCTVEIGIAPVKPAEFIVVQISQWEGGSTSTVAGELTAGA